MDQGGYIKKEHMDLIKHLDPSLAEQVLMNLQIKGIERRHYNETEKYLANLKLIETREELDKGTCKIKAFQKFYNSLKKKPKSHQPGSEFYWAGVSPPESGEGYEGLNKRYIKLSKSKQINFILVCYEQRGVTETETGIGFHTHCIINQSGGRSNFNIKQQFNRSFAKAGITNIIPMVKDYFDDKVRYMTGQKDNDPDGIKKKRVEMDSIMRKTLGIKILHFFKDGVHKQLDGTPNLSRLKELYLI